MQAKQTSSWSFWRVLLDYPVMPLCAGLFLVVWPLRPEMASSTNLEILLLGWSLLSVMAVAQAMVLVTGGIDLSLPAVMALASVVGATAMAGGNPVANTALAVPVAVLLMLAVGLLAGCAHGMAVAVLKMPAFLVTLSSLMLLSGVAVWSTQSERIAVPPQFVEIWYGRWAGIPFPVLTVAGLALLAHLVLAHTAMGRRLYAVGHNTEAARISGVPIRRTTVFAYMASGFCASVASVFYTARLYTGSPELVENEVLLDAIGAAVIGGTSLSGGKGSIWGVVAGALFMALVGNSLNMLGLRYWHVIMVKGAVILLAAALDAARSNWFVNR